MAAKLKIPAGAIFTLILGVSGCTEPFRYNATAEGHEAVNRNRPDRLMASGEFSVSLEDSFKEPACSSDGFTRYHKEDIPRAAAAKMNKSAEERNISLRIHQERPESFRLRSASLAREDINYGYFPVVLNQEVKDWIRFFTTRGRPTFNEWLSRAAAVRKTIVPLLMDAGVPEELFYLAMIESGFSHHASSRGRASGPWQFVPGTARLYDLQINFWKDERRDPIKSTLAAATYLKDLRLRFGDWYLAMAAYNTGPGRVDAAIRKANSRNYWVLSRSSLVSKETRNYVPKMLAAVILGNSPESYGFEVVADPSWSVPLHSVVLKRSVNISEVARYLGVSHEQLRMWNPELLHGITPPLRWCQGGFYALKLPEPYITRFEMIEPMLSRTDVNHLQIYKSRPGDSLSSLSHRLGIPLSQLRQLNPGLSNRLLKKTRIRVLAPKSRT